MRRSWLRLRRSSLWQRFLRLWREPRIRLPAPGLRPEALRPGDRLQIDSRLWRVESRLDTARPADPAAIFELTAAEGPPSRARLRVAAGRWSFATEDDGSRVIQLDPAGVIHFPVCPDDDPDRPM